MDRLNQGGFFFGKVKKPLAEEAGKLFRWIKKLNKKD